MSNQFDGLTGNLAQSVMHRAALRSRRHDLAGAALTAFGRVAHAHANPVDRNKPTPTNTRPLSSLTRELVAVLWLASLTAAPAQTAGEAWVRRYDSGDDGASAIVVDHSGNVYVTGYTGSGGNHDYATVAYSGAGVPLWTNRYNGPGNYHDEPAAIAVDGSGNVFVTGMSANVILNEFDYATIKYSGAGVPLWTNRYNGTGIGNDAAFAVALDGSGNVFVTGSSSNGPQSRLSIE